MPTVNEKFSEEEAVPYFQEENDLPPSIPESLKNRMAAITEEAFHAIGELNINSKNIDLVFDLENIKPTPSVRKLKERILLEIPLLFLIQPEDLRNTSPVYLWAMNCFGRRPLTIKDQNNLNALADFLKDPIKAKLAKKFVLYHELAHILHDHLNLCDDKTAREREKQADLTAARLSKAGDGGIYLFNILSKYETTTPRHPSCLERVSYLKERLY